MTVGGERCAAWSKLATWASENLIETIKTIVLIFLDVLTTLAIFAGLAAISWALSFFGARFKFSGEFRSAFHGLHEVVSICMYLVLASRSINHLTRGFFGSLLSRLLKG